MERIAAGGLSRAVASLSGLEASRLSPVEGKVVCPLPTRQLRPSRSAASLDEAVVPTREDDCVEELRRILEVDCSMDPDPAPAPFLGVSPPLRSGACNPLMHDGQWKLKAQMASRTSLEALQTLDGGCGARRVPAAASACRGDYRLLFSPPSEYSLLGVLCDAEQAAGAAAGRACAPRPRGAAAPPSWRASSRSPDARIFG